MNVILFDMDKTLVDVDTVDLWIKFLFKKGLVSPADLKLTQKFNEDYDAGILDVNASYKFIVSMAKDLAQSSTDLDKLIELRQDFFDECILDNISAKGMKLVQEYRNDPNNIVVLITATIDFIALPVFNFLDLDHLIATDTNIHDTNNLEPMIYGVPSIGVGKLEKYHQWKTYHQLNVKHSRLYSDSINDLPLLSHVDVAIAVDPDPMLHKIATYNQWEIISLRNGS